MLARGASYERGGGVVLRATMQVNSEQSLMHGGSRIGERGAVLDETCLLYVWEAPPGPPPAVPEPWLPRFRTAEHAATRLF